MKKIAFLGAKKIGLECLKVLERHSASYDFEIVGVLTNSRGENIKHYANSKRLNLLGSLSDYLALSDIDITISVQFDKILKVEHINKAKEVSINLHMAPLPEFRGCNQFSHAILQNRSIFGTTIHIIDEGIDSGPILFEERFDIPADVWVEDLYNLTFQKSIELFERSLKSIVDLDFTPVPQEKLIADRGSEIHYRNEIEQLKCLDLASSEMQLERQIRATYMPGFSPPFFEIGGVKYSISKLDKDT